MAGVPHGLFFAHHWFLACDDHADPVIVRSRLDESLKKLNDDYAVERGSALKEVIVTVLRESVFLSFMEQKGKLGGQHKFPRVMKGKMLEEWLAFVEGK